MSVSVSVSTPLEVARAFTEAYAIGEVARVAHLLAPDVREREIVPGAIVDQHGRDAIVAEATNFLAPHGTPEVLRNEVEPVGPLVRWSTRWRLLGDGDARLVEWHAFLTVEEGRICAMDVVCSGLVAESIEEASS